MVFGRKQQGEFTDASNLNVNLPENAIELQKALIHPESEWGDMNMDLVVSNLGPIELFLVRENLELAGQLGLLGLDKAANFLKKHNQVKFLWKTYGTHDMIFTVVCDKAEVGQAVYTFKKELEKLDIHPTRFDESASITWEKIDFNPF